MSHLEDHFSHYRDNTIGYNKEYDTCYGNVNMVYADWTASGRLYYPIEKRITNTFGPYVGNTHTQSNVTGSTMTEAYTQAKNIIKKHFNADERDVLLTAGSGMTSAIAKLQRIMGLRLPSAWQDSINLSGNNRPLIFITHMEHHSNFISWLETIADVVCIRPDASGFVDLNHLEYLLQKFSNRRFKIGSFTACSNVTGITTPYNTMAKLMHLHGGICFVDCSASAPYAKINMHPEDPLEKLDGIFYSPHKFLGGPGSCGILIFDSRLYSSTAPDNPGGGTVSWTNSWGEYRYVPEIELLEDGGTPAFLQTIKAALCINLKEDMGINRMMRRESELTGILFKGLSRVQGMQILEENIRNRLAIVSIYTDNIHYNLAVKILNDYYGIQCRGGCSCAGPYGHYLLHIDRFESTLITSRIDSGDLSTKPGWVRISLHPIMTNDEVHYIVHSIKDMIENIKSFRKNYDYDSKTNEFRNIKEISSCRKRVKKWFSL